MGLSIHYSGRFNPMASLQQMITEVKDIAEIHTWKYFVFEDKFPANSLDKAGYNEDIYGICVTPPGCETIDLCFLSNGKMSSAPNLKFHGHPANKKEAEYLYMLSVKTQYAGIEIHKLIIHLFKYLSGKYLLDFALFDEGNYWETGEENLLVDAFNRYGAITGSLASALQNYPIEPGESYEVYIERLCKQIHKSKG